MLYIVIAILIVFAICWGWQAATEYKNTPPEFYTTAEDRELFTGIVFFLHTIGCPFIVVYKIARKLYLFLK